MVIKSQLVICGCISKNTLYKTRIISEHRNVLSEPPSRKVLLPQLLAVLTPGTLLGDLAPVPVGHSDSWGQSLKIAL